eukprot:CAMPEP_0195057688 /NCGR_PEP_ID=MMETSP0448-20130528/5761_1 /TAXON_ID=66468 /ORGANISM="Heterocapsa triquestra, Strain CCMP 448" /LENGTH=68 /DNA_ID=CAMNT_0040087721 /DNA_START=105 /DNA_END=307 /DNA_ORIENTATION=+
MGADERGVTQPGQESPAQLRASEQRQAVSIKCWRKGSSMGADERRVTQPWQESPAQLRASERRGSDHA